MAKRRSKRSRPQPGPAGRARAPKAARDAAPALVTSSDEPAFWFAFSVPRLKLVALRVAVFSVLAIDAALQLATASRYGATSFNVAHLPLLDSLAPGRTLFGLAQLVLAALFAFAAFGLATRIVIPLAAAIYAWVYFTSQVDSYQHHYLIAIVLFVACFVPWHINAAQVRVWALRLLLVVLAIVYLWAAISKLDPAWLDGTALDKQLTGRPRALADATLGMRGAAIAVVVAELVLAATLWRRPTWRVAAPIGIALHVGILAAGFEIGLFAHLMLALYLAVLPDRWFGASVPSLLPSRLANQRAVLVAGIVGGCVAAWASQLPGALAVAIAASIGAVALALTPGALPGMLGAALVAVTLSWLAIGRLTATATDYYNYLAGAHRRLATSRTSDDATRADHRELAVDAYQKLIEIDPNHAAARYHLGRLLVAQDDDRGVEHLRHAQTLEPKHARASAELARYFARRGRSAEAITAARAAVAAEPGSNDARALLETLEGGGKPVQGRAVEGDP